MTHSTSVTVIGPTADEEYVVTLEHDGDQWQLTPYPTEDLARDDADAIREWATETAEHDVIRLDLARAMKVLYRLKDTVRRADPGPLGWSPRTAEALADFDRLLARYPE